MAKVDEGQSIVCDANVLIDYLKSDKEVLKLICSYYKVYVPLLVLKEVTDPPFTKEDAEELDIEIVEPDLNLLKSGEMEEIKKLSLADKSCLILCETHKWICVTNDALLEKKCKSKNIQVHPGLKLMIKLCETGKLDYKKAMDTAEKIPMFSEHSKQVYNDFKNDMENYKN